MKEFDEVVGQHTRTHPEMSAEEEQAERAAGFIDAYGRRLPAALLFLLVFLAAMVAWGIYFIFLRPK